MGTPENHKCTLSNLKKMSLLFCQNCHGNAASDPTSILLPKMSNHSNIGKVREAFIVMTDSINKGYQCVSESILPNSVHSSGMARSSITDSSSFPNTGGLHPCETLTHAVIAATGLRCDYRLNNCQITMAACRLELTPCRRSLAKALKKKNQTKKNKKQRLSLLHSALLRTQVSTWQLGKRWYACDGCIRGQGTESG